MEVKIGVANDPNFEQTTISISIPEDAKQVGVLASGGIDSTIVLYMVIQELKRTNSTLPLRVFTVPFVSCVETVFRLLSLPEFQYDFLTFEPNIDNGDGLNREKTTPGIRNAVKNSLSFPGIYVFTGLTSNPDQLNNTSGVPIRAKTHKENEIIPYQFLLKTHTIATYYALKVEHLLQNTFTCTENKYTACGECYACREKAWAFDYLRSISYISQWR